MTQMTETTTAKPTERDDRSIRHNATFSDIPAAEFQAMKNQQIIDLLTWHAHLAAAGEVSQ